LPVPSEYIPIIVSVSGFLFALFIILGIVIYVRYGRKKRALIGKIRKDVETPGMSYTEAVSSQTGGGIQNRILGFLSSLGQKSASREEDRDYSKLRPVFLRAGIRRENALSIYWGAKWFFAISLPACLLIVKAIFPQILLTKIQFVAALTILALIGFYLPNFWLQIKIAKKKEAIFKGFPDALDLMVVCVEAGMGLDSAITRVANEMASTNKVLSEELTIYNLEMRAGKLRRDALKNLSMRCGVPEVDNLVTLLIQTDKFGTSISKSLRVYSDTMRVQRMQRAEEIAAKIPIKLLFPLIFFVFPSLFVAILGPAAINIYRVLIKGVLRN
jgi:tight adherence protein C